jgi:hypothetical protein
VDRTRPGGAVSHFGGWLGGLSEKRRAVCSADCLVSEPAS